MENNKFATETDSEYCKIQFYKTTIKGFWIMSILACLGFIVGWKTFLFFEAIALSSCVVVFAQNKNKGHHWRLEFENNELIITNLETKYR